MNRKKSLREKMPRPLLLLTAFFSFLGWNSVSYARESFSYCSNGQCQVITTEFFHRVRGMPLDLHFSCKENNHYALTFDDGPSSHFPRLMDLLDQHQIKASFLVVGQNLENPENQALLEEAFKRGHFISNHTFTHADLTQLSDEKILSEVSRTKEKILELLGDSERLRLSTSIVRPPYGNIDLRTQEVLKKNGFISVRWNGDRYDWQYGPEEVSIIVGRIRQQLDFIESQRNAGREFNHSILDLNHDNREVSLKALEQMIPIIKEKGYQFVTLDECLGV